MKKDPAMKMKKAPTKMGHKSATKMKKTPAKLTAAQKKLPVELQKIIAKKEGEKKTIAKMKKSMATMKKSMAMMMKRSAATLKKETALKMKMKKKK